MRRCKPALALAGSIVGLAGAVPAPAWAATATVSDRVLHYEAAAGEVNQLSLGVITGETAVEIVDTATIAAGTGCTATHDPRRVRCELAGFDRVTVSLGDMADRAHAYQLAAPLEVSGGAGDDDLAGGENDEKMDGGGGDDLLTADFAGSAGSDVYTGGDGVDTVFYRRHAPQTISLDGVANDGLPGEGDNVGADIEKVFGGYAADTIIGSEGDDFLNGDMGADILQGLGGDDTLDGWYSCEADRLFGGEDDDTLLLEGDTRADGGPGDDTIKPGFATCGNGDEVIGGPGRDTADYREYSSSQDLTISLDGEANDAYGEASNVHPDIEVVKGSNYGSILIGSDGPDELIGGASGDLLMGGGGTDTLLGGPGFDVADYSDHSAAVSLTLNGAGDDGSPGEDENLGDDIEDLRGGDGDDTLKGDDGDNVLDGGPGADLILGGPGIDAADYFLREAPVTVDLDGATGDDGETGEGDTVSADVEGVFGGLGADTLTGNSGDGFLDGAEGDDTLVDAGGEDDLTGGAGADSIHAADQAVDRISCGTEDDAVEADPIDELGEDCETADSGEIITPPVEEEPAVPVARTPRPTRPPSVRPPLPAPVTLAPVPVPLPDTLAPTAALIAPAKVRLKSLLARRVRVTVRCGEPCVATVRLTATGRPAVLARGSDLARRPEHVLTLRPTRQGRRILSRLRPARVKLTLTVTDGAGNSARLTRTLRVRP